MREILFRGKRVDNGELVYGYYVQDLQGGHLILTDEGTWLGGPVLDAIDVIPETVGQYTGLDDKNGVKIFEGDIIYDSWHTLNGTVEFNERFGGWWYYDKDRFGTALQGDESEGIEVVGNIHDNKELTEVRP